VTKLQELEKRLKREPDNLVLRVMVATALREAGRSVEAVELYRSVALAYRDQGRKQQAIAVCRSILEIAPEDSACQALLSSLATTSSKPPASSASPSQPPRRSSLEATPLPKPVPHHVADPTSSVSTPRIDPADVHDPDLPAVEGAETRPGAEERPEVSGLAEAARRISGLIRADQDGGELEIDLASELDTRKVQRIDPSQLKKILGPPPTVPVPRVELTPIPDDAVTPVTATRDSAEEVTSPRELVERATPKKPER
jgi:hypothetical protein